MLGLLAMLAYTAAAWPVRVRTRWPDMALAIGWVAHGVALGRIEGVEQLQEAPRGASVAVGRGRDRNLADGGEEVHASLCAMVKQHMGHRSESESRVAMDGGA